MRGLPRREPPSALRDRVLAEARSHRASVLRPQLAFVAFVVLVLLDLAVLRWQDGDAIVPPTRPPVAAQASEKQRDDLLALVQETCHANAWQLSLSPRPERPESYLRLRDRVINAVDRG